MFPSVYDHVGLCLQKLPVIRPLLFLHPPRVILVGFIGPLPHLHRIGLQFHEVIQFFPHVPDVFLILLPRVIVLPDGLIDGNVLYPRLDAADTPPFGDALRAPAIGVQAQKLFGALILTADAGKHLHSLHGQKIGFLQSCLLRRPSQLRILFQQLSRAADQDVAGQVFQLIEGVVYGRVELEFDAVGNQLAQLLRVARLVFIQRLLGILPPGLDGNTEIFTHVVNGPVAALSVVNHGKIAGVHGDVVNGVLLFRQAGSLVPLHVSAVLLHHGGAHAQSGELIVRDLVSAHFDS